MILEPASLKNRAFKRQLKNLPNGDKLEKTIAKSKKMRPYKKRSFHSQLQMADNSMEIENSDDSEKQVSPPSPDEDPDKERDKDKEGEVKSRKKWKRKISRKQFRHHDIKLFTPGEYRTSTFLKQKDATVSKKSEMISKELITESIVTSLGGQRQALAQRARLEETTDSNLSNKSEMEENNNNVNATQNNNGVGKHQLPAIIRETPPARRNSDKSFPIKPADQTSAKKSPVDARIPGHPYPLLHNPAINDIKRENAHSTAKEQDNKSKIQNTIKIELFLKDEVGRENGRAKGNQNNEQYLQKKEIVQVEQKEPMDYALEEQPENLSLKRRCSVDAPVDLSKKVSAAPTLHSYQESCRYQSYKQQGNGYVEPSSRDRVRANTYFPSSPIIEPNRRDPFEKPVAPNIKSHNKNSDYGQNNQQKKDIAIRNNNNNNSIRKATTIENHPQTTTLTNLDMWRDTLQSLLSQGQFNPHLLSLMSHAYRELDAIVGEASVPSDVRWNAQKVLVDTYNFISVKLKELGLESNAIDVITILGQSEANAEKKILQSNLENIQRGINDFQFIAPQNNNNQAPLYSNVSMQPRQGLATKALPNEQVVNYQDNNINHHLVHSELIPTTNQYAFVDAIVPNYLRKIPYIPPNPYISYRSNDSAISGAKNYNNSARLRNKSHIRQTDAPERQQLKRSISNPIDKKMALGYHYNSNQYFLPPNAVVPPNVLQNGDVSITPYPEMFYPGMQSEIMPKSTSNKYRHTFPEYPAQLHAALPMMRGLVLDDHHAKKLPTIEDLNNVAFKPTEKQFGLDRLEAKISSTTENLEVPKISRKKEYEPDSKPKPPLEKTKTIPAVIIADNSMQITKEPPAPARDKKKKPDVLEENDSHVTMITSSSEGSPKQSADKEQEEDFQVWLKKLNSDEKLKKKFLSKLIVKNEKSSYSGASGDCIEISDSDEELTKPIQSEQNAKLTVPAAAGATKTNNKITTITVPHAMEITPISPSKPKKSSIAKQSLSKSDYIPPISLPYVPATTVKEKNIYSPKIEPISPVNNSEQSFTFPPETSTASKVIEGRHPPQLVPISAATEGGVALRETISSPTYVQKRKTPLSFADEPVNNPNRRTSADYSSDSGSKRRKSLDRPQTAMSPRVAPSGKLCYVRESHMFLRYFDDTQMELFIKNLSSQDEELLRTTGIDPEKIKNSYKNSNFGLEHLTKTEIIRLPREIEFSRKEDLPDVEEFVKESSLVERFVPKDFSDFYRYVTGFQIIKNKHPVSLQTFLTMYNTNRTTELLRKYLQRRDEDLITR